VKSGVSKEGREERQRIGAICCRPVRLRFTGVSCASAQKAPPLKRRATAKFQGSRNCCSPGLQTRGVSDPFENAFSNRARSQSRCAKPSGHHVLQGLALKLAFMAIAAFSAQNANTQQLPQATANPETALTDALTAACRQDSPAFSNSLTADNATAFRELPGPQRTAVMKRFVLLEEPGRPLLSTSSDGHRIVRCESSGFTVELRLSETRVRGNLAFVPMEIPIPGEDPHKITFGLVREGGGWKMLSVGLILLDVPTLAKQWEQADLDANEGVAIADLRSVAEAVKTYRNAYGILPETLAALGPAPPGGVSPDAAGLLDTDLAAGEKNGYTLRYTIVPATDFAPVEDSGKAVNFSIASSPKEYGKTGRKSFFLDSSGILRGADKKGAVATTTDPRIEAGPS
jgi:hypothetical protein